METSERYQVIDENHGQGGFGKVSKHRDLFLNRIVAVKELLSLTDPKIKDRFINEAKILAKLSHPHIPAIYDIKNSGESLQIHFEFIDGINLADFIASKITPSISEIQIWFGQVASALEHAHSLGIIHRDIKPSNIIISKDRASAFLVDFGIALSPEDLKRLTSTGYVIGTPEYMSPEQISGKPIKSNTDLYSLGIALYETIMGIRPSPNHYNEVSEANESFPPAIDDLIRECLVHAPESRISTAEDFSKKLKSAIRKDAPLSTLLTDARLHELHAALDEMSAEDFHIKPLGQKLLVINKAKTLVRLNRDNMRRPTASLLGILVRLAQFEAFDSYKIIVDAAFIWGFEIEYGPNWHGDEAIRESVEHTCKVVTKDGHAVLSASILEFINTVSLDGKENWYYQSLRLIVAALLANQNCEDENAMKLSDMYNNIVEITN